MAKTPVTGQTTEDWLKELNDSLEMVDYDWRDFHDHVGDWPHPVRESDRTQIEAALKRVWAAVAELRNAAFFYRRPQERQSPEFRDEWTKDVG